MLASYINKLFHSSEEGNEDGRCKFDYKSIVRKTREQKYQTIWGPEGFKKETHPLAMMVCLL